MISQVPARFDRWSSLSLFRNDKRLSWRKIEVSSHSKRPFWDIWRKRENFVMTYHWKLITSKLFIKVCTFVKRNIVEIDLNFVLSTENVTPAASIPLDVALIIIASIVFLSLMSVAIVTIIHTRTKLFETVRLSIYNDEKEKNSERKSKKQRPPGRISTIIDSALPRKLCQRCYDVLSPLIRNSRFLLR